MIRKLFDSGYKMSMYTTGCNSSLLSWLTLEPGASKCVIELRNAYSYGAAGSLLPNEPKSWISEPVSYHFAQSAYLQALKYELKEAKGDIQHVKSDKVLAVGVTGAIKTNREKKGDHKAYISLMDMERRCLSG